MKEGPQALEPEDIKNGPNNRSPALPFVLRQKSKEKRKKKEANNDHGK